MKGLIGCLSVKKGLLLHHRPALPQWSGQSGDTEPAEIRKKENLLYNFKKYMCIVCCYWFSSLQYDKTNNSGWFLFCDSASVNLCLPQMWDTNDTAGYCS